MQTLTIDIIVGIDAASPEVTSYLYQLWRLIFVQSFGLLIIACRAQLHKSTILIDSNPRSETRFMLRVICFFSDSRYCHFQKALGKKGSFWLKRVAIEQEFYLHYIYNPGSDSETCDVWVSVPRPFPILPKTEFRYQVRFRDKTSFATALSKSIVFSIW